MEYELQAVSDAMVWILHALCGCAEEAKQLAQWPESGYKRVTGARGVSTSSDPCALVGEVTKKFTYNHRL